MSSSPDTPDPDTQMLARLAELDLAAAERVHAKLMTAEEPSHVAELGRTYQRLARSLRQTLALKGQIQRQRAQAEQERSEQAGRPTRGGVPRPVAVARRMIALREAVLRVAWDEHEDMEMLEHLAADLDETLEERREMMNFLDQDLDDHVAGYCLSLGFDPERAVGWRDLPPAPHVARKAFDDDDDDDEGEDNDESDDESDEDPSEEDPADPP